MATYTDALVSLEQVVTTYLFSYRKTTDDYSLYVQHACRCVEDFNLYDGNQIVTAKVTLDTTLKCIEMPDDMQTFIDLVTPFRGQWWSFTEKDRIVNTTTFTGLVEGRDEAQGEGKIIDQGRTITYGAKGGWNKFRYTIDWAARRIYVDETYTANDYIVLMYTSSGIKAAEDTLVPTFIVPVIENYLLWKETYWLPELIRERDDRYVTYWRYRSNVRNLVNTMSIQQWKDLLYSTSTQAPQR